MESVPIDADAVEGPITVHMSPIRRAKPSPRKPSVTEEVGLSVVSFDPGSKDLAWCACYIMAQPTTDVTVVPLRLCDIEWGVEDVKGKNCAETVATLWDWLSDWPELPPCTMYVIESQFQNTTNVAISHALQCCLLHRGVPSEQIVFQHPRFKIPKVCSLYWAFKFPTELSNVVGYAVNKKKSILLGRYILALYGKNTCLTQLREAAAHQRDDLTDSLLLAIAEAARHFGIHRPICPRQRAARPTATKAKVTRARPIRLAQQQDSST